MACDKNHDAVQTAMSKLPIDQGRVGRHKCAACAYEIGLENGKDLLEDIDLKSILNSLEYSQAKEQRHKSPHAGYAAGYLKGVEEYYK